MKQCQLAIAFAILWFSYEENVSCRVSKTSNKYFGKIDYNVCERILDC